MDAYGITSTTLLVWAFFGLLAGSFATTLDRNHVAGGNFATEIFGSLGAIVSGYLATFFLGNTVTHFSFSVLLLSAIGAFLLARFYQVSFSDQRHIRY